MKAEKVLLIPEDPSMVSVFGNFMKNVVTRKDNNKQNEAWNGPFKRINKNF